MPGADAGQPRRSPHRRNLPPRHSCAGRNPSSRAGLRSSPQPPSLQRKGAANAVSGGCPGRRGAVRGCHPHPQPSLNPRNTRFRLCPLRPSAPTLRHSGGSRNPEERRGGATRQNPTPTQTATTQPPSLQRKGAANAVSGGCPGRRGAVRGCHPNPQPSLNPRNTRFRLCPLRPSAPTLLWIPAEAGIQRSGAAGLHGRTPPPRRPPPPSPLRSSVRGRRAQRAGDARGGRGAPPIPPPPQPPPTPLLPHPLILHPPILLHPSHPSSQKAPPPIFLRPTSPPTQFHPNLPPNHKTHPYFHIKTLPNLPTPPPHPTRPTSPAAPRRSPHPLRHPHAASNPPAQKRVRPLRSSVRGRERAKRCERGMPGAARRGTPQIPKQPRPTPGPPNRLTLPKTSRPDTKIPTILKSP